MSGCNFCSLADRLLLPLLFSYIFCRVIYETLICSADLVASRIEYGSPGLVASIIYGLCQLGKTKEALAAAWTAAFKYGLLPILLVRNS